MPTPDEYQEATGHTAIYADACKQIANGNPEEIARLLRILYLTGGIAGEAGEVNEKTKKLIRDKCGVIDAEFVEIISKEVGDVLWYAARLSAELGISLEKIMQDNIDKLTDRAKRGVIGGSGDKR